MGSKKGAGVGPHPIAAAPDTTVVVEDGRGSLSMRGNWRAVWRRSKAKLQGQLWEWGVGWWMKRLTPLERFWDEGLKKAAEEKYGSKSIQCHK